MITEILISVSIYSSQTTQTCKRKTDLTNRWRRKTYQAASCAIRLFKRGGEADTLTNETQDLLIDILISKIYLCANKREQIIQFSIDLLKYLQSVHVFTTPRRWYQLSFRQLRQRREECTLC